MADPAASDYISPNKDISPPYVPPNILPVPETDGKHVAKPKSQVDTTPKITTPHPTLSQGLSTAMPSNGGKQQ